MRCAMVSQAGVKQQVGLRLPGKQVPVQAKEMPQVYEEAVHRPANRSRSSRTPPPPPPMNQRQTPRRSSWTVNPEAVLPIPLVHLLGFHLLETSQCVLRQELL